MIQTFYGLSPESMSLVEAAQRIATDVVAPNAGKVDGGEYPRAAMTALGKAGLLGLTLPTQFGGKGEGPKTFIAIAETLARACASTGMVYVMHVCASNVIAAKPPAKGGEQILRDIAAGKHLSTLAFSEKGSRSHFWAPVSKERVEGGKVLLNANKTWVTSAGEADSYVVSTLAASGKTMTESSLYLVPKGAKGFDVQSRFDGLGMRGNSSAAVKLNDVETDPSMLVSAPGGGFDVMMGVVLPWFQIGTSAISVGIAEGAIEATGKHLTGAKLEHLNETLAGIPNNRVNFAMGRIDIDRSRAQLAYTGSAMMSPGAHTMPAVLASKAQAAEMSMRVTDLAMRCCGGAAFSKHLPVERAFRDARAASVMAPTTDQLHDFLGKALLGMPLF